MPKIRPRLTYANVMATVAVFIALGGGAYAVGVKKDSVGSKQLKDGSVDGVDVKDNGITGDDVLESSLVLSPGLNGAPGPKGETGATGATGADGPRGPQGTTGAQGVPGTNAPADGPAIMSGAIGTAGLNCLIGAPSGYSVSGACTQAGLDSRTIVIPTARSLRNARFQIQTALANSLSAFLMVNGAATVNCTIPAGQKSCVVAGPIAVPAGAGLVIEIDGASMPPLMGFGYELWNPAAVP